MRVREILNQKTPHSVYCVSSNETVVSAAMQMTEKNVGALAVLNRSKLVGIISERDIMTKVVSKSLDPHLVTVGEAMSTDLVVAEPDELFEQCEMLMKKARCRHVLIVEEDRLVGIISLRDILISETRIEDKKIEISPDFVWTLPTRPA